MSEEIVSACNRLRGSLIQSESDERDLEIVSSFCARPIRGCSTDEQYQLVIDRIKSIVRAIGR